MVIACIVFAMLIGGVVGLVAGMVVTGWALAKKAEQGGEISLGFITLVKKQ